jgi:16S rRNA pseudouridine516 synthase
MRRIDQLLANLGYCSRREARDWVAAGRVTISGRVVEDSGTKAYPATVQVDGEPLDHPDGLLLLYHKPVGVVCSHDPREAPLIYDALPGRWTHRNPLLTSVGRLDKETSGLLLLTDQSHLVHRLTSPKKEMPKVYLATLDADLPDQAMSAFGSGRLLLEGDEKPCAPAVLERLGPRSARVTLTEGRYHQVRRMFASQGATVVTLHRERFGHLTLEGVDVGSWKELPINNF